MNNINLPAYHKCAVNFIITQAVPVLSIIRLLNNSQLYFVDTSGALQNRQGFHW